MTLTNDQVQVRNTALKLIAALKDQAPSEPMSHDLIEELVKTGANVLIDLNRIANAMEALAALGLMQANNPNGGKSPIITR